MTGRKVPGQLMARLDGRNREPHGRTSVLLLGKEWRSCGDSAPFYQLRLAEQKQDRPKGGTMKKSPVVLILAFSLSILGACGGGGSSNSVKSGTPPAATHFSISAPASATAGTAFNFTVTALDASNNTVTTYSGTAHFTSTDTKAVLPADSTLTNGTANFSATLETAGNQTITATDTVTASITGSSSSISVGAAAATHFSVTAPASATAGTAFNFTVTALDASNNTVTIYSGTVHFTSTDSQAVLPANSALTNGTGSFPATLKTAGSQTITATDTVTASITGSSKAITVSSPVLGATHFSVTAPVLATAGTPFNFMVTALDASNNTVTTYSGTVHFTSTDGLAVLPANSTLTKGTGNFSATLNTAGNQTITATDTVTASITGSSSSINVSAAAVATHFSVTAPASATVGTAFNFTVTALDASNKTVTTYAGTVHFTSTDGQTVLPANSTLTNGTGTFSATLKTAGSQTITATDTVTASITGSSSSISVSAAAVATHFSVTAPASATAGTAFNITVTALDASNKTVTTYAGTVHFTSSDGQAVLPGNSTLTNGTGTFSATLKTAGSQTITATDTVTASITGSSSSISVSPATVATHFSVAAPASATAGTALNFTVTALDASNKTVTTYAGTVHFTSSDGHAVLPANSTLTNGTGTFSATLKTAGSQTITATDTVTASITGSSSSISVAAAAATHFSVTAPASATAGTALNFTVTALDASNNTVTAYSGIVQFTSTDAKALLPANSMLTKGTGSFSATLNTTGDQTITATDTVIASITGSSKSILVSAATAESPVPFINDPLIPTAVAPGGAGFTLTVNGTGFVTGSVVEWNGSARTTTFVSKSKLTAAILASDISAVGTASVTVVNPAPGGGSSNVAFFEVTKSTTWAALLHPTFLTSTSAQSAAVGDFNGDGKLDLVVTTDEDFGANAGILLGNGDGTFQPAKTFNAGFGPDSVVVADFNGDGKPDLGVVDIFGLAGFTGGSVNLILGNGDGTFQTPVSLNFPATSEPFLAAMGDFNGDGRLDLAVTSSSGVSILLQPAIAPGPNATLFPTSLLFQCSPTPSGCQCTTFLATTLSNFGSAALDISSIDTTNGFSQTNDCGTGLQPGQSCLITVKWLQKNNFPSGTLSISDNALGSPQTVSLDTSIQCTAAAASSADPAARPAACAGK